MGAALQEKTQREGGDCSFFRRAEGGGCTGKSFLKTTMTGMGAKVTLLSQGKALELRATIIHSRGSK